MKRDLDLVRSILITAEESDDPVGFDTLLECEQRVEACLHVELMRSRGLVEAIVRYDGPTRSPMDAEVSSVTKEISNLISQAVTRYDQQK